MIGNSSRKGYHQGGKQEEDETSNTAHHHHQQQQHMMISNNSNIDKLYSNSKVVGSSSSSSSRQWSSLRNPRIVRVSRSFGGKDRHSKVCTIRGLRDRRIRLSVPTAIQLYELQDRLGLNQPSKVIDWLIEATKQDIDKLPPLPFPLGFPQFHHPQLNQTLLLPPLPDDHHHHHHSNFGPNFFEAAANTNKNNNNSSTSFIDKGKWVMKANYEEGEGGIGGASGSAQNLFPSGNYSNNPFHSDQPSNFLSLFGSHGVFPNNSNNHNHHQEEVNPGHSSSVQQFSSSATNAPSPLFAPYYAAPYSSVSLEADPRIQQLNHIQLMMTSSSNNSNPLVLPSLMKPLIPTPPFSSRILDSNDHHKDTSTRPS